MHPLEVASLLKRSGYPDHVVAAAVLHDVLEDSDTKPAELKPRFGPEVTGLVRAVSDDPAIEDSEQQKDDVRERIRGIGGYAAAGGETMRTVIGARRDCEVARTAALSESGTLRCSS